MLFAVCHIKILYIKRYSFIKMKSKYPLCNDIFVCPPGSWRLILYMLKFQVCAATRHWGDILTWLLRRYKPNSAVAFNCRFHYTCSSSVRFTGRFPEWNAHQQPTASPCCPDYAAWGRPARLTTGAVKVKSGIRDDYYYYFFNNFL